MKKSLEALKSTLKQPLASLTGSGLAACRKPLTRGEGSGGGIG